MWIVQTKETGVVVFRSSDRKFAHGWWLDNNFDEEGKDLGLFKLVKAKGLVS